MVGGRDAAEAIGDVVGGVEPGAGAGEGVGPVLFDPEDLAQPEDRLQGKAGEGVEAVSADCACEPFDLGLRSPVEPGDGVTGGPAMRVYGNARFSHAGNGDAGNTTRVLQPVNGLPQRGYGALPQFLRPVVGPGGPGVVRGRAHAGLRHGPSRGVENEGLDAGGAKVNADQKRLTGHFLFSVRDHRSLDQRTP